MIRYKPFLRYILRKIPTVILAISLSACSCHYGNNTKTSTYSKNNQNDFFVQKSQEEFEKIVQNINIKSRILDQYANWKGVRYRFGGTTKRGIDCSAFVQVTFRDQFGLNLPRSTREQEDSGYQVPRSKLRPGDLIFFRARATTGRHIGIYLGNDNFVHASTSSGVIISSLKKTYWKKRYWEARRVLNLTKS